MCHEAAIPPFICRLVHELNSHTMIEVWDSKATTCHGKVLPGFNRCVIFSKSDISYHGQPERRRCQNDMQRNSVALYD